jgi:hypothetical protein
MCTSLDCHCSKSSGSPNIKAILHRVTASLRVVSDAALLVVLGRATVAEISDIYGFFVAAVVTWLDAELA